MTNLQIITSVNADMSNKTNGAITKYTISMVPSTIIKDGDLIDIVFPKELVLPFEIKCSSTSEFVISFTCTNLQANKVQFKLTELNPTLKIGDEITLSVDNVQNSVSLRPSSSFKNITIIDSKSNLEISEFLGNVIVQNKHLANIPRDTAEIE